MRALVLGMAECHRSAVSMPTDWLLAVLAHDPKPLYRANPIHPRCSASRHPAEQGFGEAVLIRPYKGRTTQGTSNPIKTKIYPTEQKTFRLHLGDSFTYEFRCLGRR
jgi:hypothetical protein